MIAQTQSSGLSLLLPLLLVVPFFLMIRSQRKRTRQQQMLQQSVEVGDEIMTTSGIFGTIVDEDEDEGTIMLEIAPGTTIKMVRAGISRRLGELYGVPDGDGDDDENAEGPIRS
jgi:preprotein translocase subunit YajC